MLDRNRPFDRRPIYQQQRMRVFARFLEPPSPPRTKPLMMAAAELPQHQVKNLFWSWQLLQQLLEVAFVNVDCSTTIRRHMRQFPQEPGGRRQAK